MWAASWVASETPCTSTGTSELAFWLPSPSAPELALPQQSTCPLDSNAHESPSATETATTEVRPSTSTGTSELARVPLPSCPDSFAPQHSTWPLDNTRHPWPTPTASQAAPAPAEHTRHP